MATRDTSVYYRAVIRDPVLARVRSRPESFALPSLRSDIATDLRPTRCSLVVQPTQFGNSTAFDDR